MSNSRKEPRRGYTHIENAIFTENNGLSFRARGLLCYLWSKPDGWDVRIDSLARVGPEGKEAITTAMRELVVAGFVMRIRERNDKGQVKTTTLISDYPKYIDVGTVEDRLQGYKSTEGSETEGSETEGSESRASVEGGVYITTDLQTTDHKEKTDRERALSVGSANGNPYVQAYYRIWGLTLSPYQDEKIKDWETRVPLEFWEHSLKVSVDNGKKGRWDYLEGVLRNVEVEGIKGKDKPAASGASNGDDKYEHGIDFVDEDFFR